MELASLALQRPPCPKQPYHINDDQLEENHTDEERESFVEGHIDYLLSVVFSVDQNPSSVEAAVHHNQIEGHELREPQHVDSSQPIDGGEFLGLA